MVNNREHAGRLAATALGFIRNAPHLMWRRVPTLKELIAYSAIQSLFELVVGIFWDIDKHFGTNPVAKSGIRDGAKAVAEVSLAQNHADQGGTGSWHDGITLVSMGHKLPVKGFIIYVYTTVKEFFIRSSINQFINSIELYMWSHNHDPLVVQISVSTLLQNHLFKDVIKDAASAANVAVDVSSRITDVSAKYRQSSLLNAAALAGTTNSQAWRAENSISLLKAIYYIKENGPRHVAHALASTPIRSLIVDYLGDRWGKDKIYDGKTISKLFAEIRQFIDARLHADNQYNPALSFRERAGAIWDAESSLPGNVIRTVPTFALELTEKTAYNMITMFFLSTSAKVLGDSLLRVDARFAFFKPVGIAVGAALSYSKFSTGGSTTQSTMDQLSEPINATEIEKCQLALFNRILAENNNVLPTTYDETDSNKKKIETYLECLSRISKESINLLHTQSIDPITQSTIDNEFYTSSALKCGLPDIDSTPGHVTFSNNPNYCALPNFGTVVEPIEDSPNLSGENSQSICLMGPWFCIA